MVKGNKEKSQGVTEATAEKDGTVKEEPKSTQSKKGDTIRVRLRTERLVEEDDARGRLTTVPRPWNLSVKHNGKVYNAGEEFECDKEFGEQLISFGQAQLAGTELKPVKPATSSDKEIFTSEGIVRRDEVEGKIPVYEAEKGNKGEWQNVEDEGFEE